MDDLYKSKTDLVRRWDVETVRLILQYDADADNVVLNLLCNPFTSDEVYSWCLINRNCKELKSHWAMAQHTYSLLKRHPLVSTAATSEGTAVTIKKSKSKLEASDGQLRTMICSLVENEPMVNELYSHIFQ